jgi:hypothetical protein
MVKNVVKGWQTTLIGCILLGVAGSYIFVVDDPKWYILLSFLLPAIGLLFVADTFLNGFKSLINNNKTKKF